MLSCIWPTYGAVSRYVCAKLFTGQAARETRKEIFLDFTSFILLVDLPDRFQLPSTVLSVRFDSLTIKLTTDPMTDSMSETRRLV